MPLHALRHAGAVILLAFAAPALADLKPGDAAPPIETQASLAGKPFAFSLDEALKKGPVVVYFYPKAFTSGCTVEAHKFAEATPQFQAAGAQVLGLSGDDIETLNRFSVAECRNQFAVGADPELKIAKAYDAASMFPGYASRTSYVITPDHKVYYAYSDGKPDGHITNTLEAVQRWRAAQGGVTGSGGAP